MYTHMCILYLYSISIPLSAVLLPFLVPFNFDSDSLGQIKIHSPFRTLILKLPFFDNHSY